MTVWDLNAFIHIAFIYALITFLHLIIPANFVRGYVQDGPPIYRLNGLRVFFIVSLLFIGYVQLIDIQFLINLRLKHAICACVLGFLFTFILVLPCKPNSSSFLLDLYLGRLKNPQWFGNRVDGKILLYLIGGIGVELNLILLYFEYAKENRSMTNITTYVILFSFFLTEYFYHEHVHLYTFDFIIEYVGFKLVWGCLVFYPFFYPIAIWCNIKPISLSFIRQILSISIFFLGWILSRGANNQKYLFRTQPKAKFLGYFQPISVNGRLLCSGWWSLSRHINYLGDILMSIGLSLAINGGIYSWLYPIYYIGLFIARERTDFERCEKKYGRDWDEYCRRVPNRIIPYLY
jgi:protein-S-isoprenylcysteine O-methyltransferase Ste14